MEITRADVLDAIDRWSDGRLATTGLQAWVAARWPAPDARFTDWEDGLSAAREALAELDLCAVHLVVPDDVPVFRRLLQAPPGATRTLVDWLRAYIAAIDRPTRSRRLKKDPFYRPFCV